VDIYKIKKDMKRLRRFNESKEEIDYDYIYQCFAEFIDDGKAEILQHDYLNIANNRINYISIILKTKSGPDQRALSRTEVIEKSKIWDFIKDVKSNSELFQEVEVSLNRLMEKYPEYKISFDNFAHSIHINIFPGEVKKEQYPF
jgi:hypothetical protein